MNIKKIITIVSVVLIAALLIFGIKLYSDIFSKNTKFSENELYVHIPTDANYEEVKNIITPYIDDMEKFEMVAAKRSYLQNVKSGRFLFKKGMNSFELITALRNNIPVKLAFNNHQQKS